MAFGFPAYHKEIYQPLAQESLLDSIQKSVHILGWTISGGTDVVICIHTSMTLWSWGEEVTITYLPNKMVEVHSKCRLFTQCVDWGRNQENVQNFLVQLNMIERTKVGN